MAEIIAPMIEQEQLGGGVAAPTSLPQTPDQTGRRRQRNTPFGKQKRNSNDPNVSCTQSSPIPQDTPRLSPAQAVPRRASLRSNSPSAPTPYNCRPRQSSSPKGNSPPTVEVIDVSDDEPSASPGSPQRNSSRLSPSSPRSSLASPRTQHPSPTSRKPRPPGFPRHEPATPQDINADLERLVRGPVDLRKTKDKKGFVYVLPAIHLASGQHLVKIGCTTQAPRRRRASLKSACGPDVEFRPPPPDRHAPQLEVRGFYRLVEQLAHADLAEFCHPFDCACGRRHREYFAVDAAAAYRAVERWARFCRRRPWVEARPAASEEACHAAECRTGPLKPWWEDRLARCTAEVAAAANAAAKAVARGEKKKGKGTGMGTEMGGAADELGRWPEYYCGARRRAWERFVDGADGSAWMAAYEGRLLAGELWRRRWQGLASLGMLAPFFLPVGPVVGMVMWHAALAVVSGLWGELARKSAMWELTAAWVRGEIGVGLPGVLGLDGEGEKQEEVDQEEEEDHDREVEGLEVETDSRNGEMRLAGAWIDTSDDDDYDDDHEDDSDDKSGREHQSVSGLHEARNVKERRLSSSTFTVPYSGDELSSDGEAMDEDD